MTDPMMTAIETETAKALVQAGMSGLSELVHKVPALFKRQGKFKQRYVADEVERTLTLPQRATGAELEFEQARQEAAWEFLLRGLMAERPEAGGELKTLAAEIRAALPGTASVGGMVGAVGAGRDSYFAGHDFTVNHYNYNPDRGESQLELSDVSLTQEGPEGGSSAVLDLKLRNTGGQPALLHRAVFHIRDALSLSLDRLVDFLPYEEEWLVGGHLPASHTYDIVLPAPAGAAGSKHDLSISQSIEPAGTDRFRIRLGIPQYPLVYLLHLDIQYDAQRILTSPAIAIMHPLGSTLATIEEIRSGLRRFRDAVRKVRNAVDQEMIARGLPAPDWANHPPTSRADLPAHLRCLGDEDPLAAIFGSKPGSGAYAVNDTFWNPEDSLTQRLYDIHAHCTRIVRIISGSTIRHHSSLRILAQAQAVLAQGGMFG